MIRKERNWKSRYQYLVFVLADSACILALIVHWDARIMGLTIEKKHLVGEFVNGVCLRYRAQEVHVEENTQEVTLDIWKIHFKYKLITIFD